MELSPQDALQLGIVDGDVLAVSSPRGTIRGQARITGIRPGVLFVPFHYGYWDSDPTAAGEHDRTANELTITAWDPASKQPIFKTAAAAVTRVRAGDGPAPAPTTTASAPTTPGIAPTTGGPTALVTDTTTHTHGGERR